jgi:hypothetical protein
MLEAIDVLKGVGSPVTEPCFEGPKANPLFF